jgi:L-lactate dehydrogenase complex protein LldE
MNGEKRVALCVTCVVDQILPEIGMSTVRLLERAGYHVHFPEAQTCCGQPFFNSGFRRQAAELAKRTIEIFEPHAAVVLPSGSCTAMIRAEYPHLLAGRSKWYARARQLASKTFELSEFLVGQARWQPASVPTAPTVTYHDSCHMCRTLALGAEPRRLLAQAGCNLVEMSESDRCCGFGGLFSLRMGDLSTAMTADKLHQAGETSADFLVTADPGCLMQMRGLAHTAGVPVEHLATLLDRLAVKEAGAEVADL